MEHAEQTARLREGQAALRTIFLNFSRSGAAPGELAFHETSGIPLIATLYRALALAEAASGGAHISGVDWIDGVNALVALTPSRPLAAALEDAFFELMTDRELDLRDWLKPRGPGREQLEFFRGNFLTVIAALAALKALLPEHSVRLNPAARGCLGPGTVLAEAPEKILAVAALRDPFQASRSFRFVDGKFYPAKPEMRSPDKFYGFHGVRSNFREHLGQFAAGRGNVPLLVSSLPGLGKTQFSMAYSLEYPEITLILAEPEALSGQMDELIDLLKRRKHRRFAVFFDDVEPAKIDWYGFRTNVGGSAILPENMMFILASNYPFPVNILSRGREITFPVFDESRCVEMIEDFLADFGLKNVNADLAAVIASSYVEEFGQKKFTELSPRTLIRYLENYRRDAALRKRILTLSQQEMIIKPDAQIFYEFNIRSLRALYGEDYIDRLREERLKALEG